MNHSLVASGFAELADGKLSDVIRTIACFGLTLAPLDIRQESTRHSQAVAAMTELIGLGDYTTWPEEKRLEWLQSELTIGRPLLPRKAFEDLGSLGLGFSDNVVDVLEVRDPHSTDYPPTRWP